MFKYVALILAVVTVALATPEREYQIAFNTWMTKFSRVYSSEEFQTRYNTWKVNYDFVKNHNVSRGFTVELNKFADMSNVEFSRIFKGVSIKKDYMPITSNYRKAENVKGDIVNWNTKGAVTDVKNQQQCQASWAFSATGSIEGANFLANGKLVSLSEQNLIDCSGMEGNMGCEGGLTDSAFEYVIKNRGINTESSYPYTAEDGTCHFNPNNTGATIRSYRDIPTADESALQTAVDSRPVSVAIDASSFEFQLYQDGVYDDPNCSSTLLDQAVLVVGYGVVDSSRTPYWIVKNSWGETWGIRGYILMSKDKNNQCGIATQASYPLSN